MTVVANQEPTPFHKVFPAKELFQGDGLKGLIWSAIGSVCLCFLLFVLGFFGDLLVTRGEVTLTADEAGQKQKRNDSVPPVTAEPAGEPGEEAEPVSLYTGYTQSRTPFGPEIDPLKPPKTESATTITNSGILPTLLRYQGAFWTRPFVALYQRFPALRDNQSALGILVGLGALLAWIRSMCASQARQRWNSTALAVSTRLRKSIHRQALRLGPADLEGGSSAQSLELFTSAVDRVSEGALEWLGYHGRDLFRLLLLAICLLLVDSVFTLVCVVPLIACWWLVFRQEHHAADLVAATLSQGDRDLRILAEGLAKTRLVRGYQMESYEQEQFQKSLERFQKSQAGALQQSAWGRRGMRTVIAAAAAFVALYLGWRVLLPPHATALASGIVVLAGFIAAWPPLKNLSQRSRVLAPATKAASQIQDYLNQIPEVGQAVGARFLQPLSRLLTFENVSYGTATHKTLLDELQFKIPAGRQVAVVSTDPLEALAVACLIPRFIEPQKGKILIDGEDIAWVTLDSLRAEAILVGGKDPFISGSVRDNISGGNTATSLNEITEAAKESHAHNFIQRLPQGYETIIGAQGEQLDAGQSFRLGLARALLRKPALLIVEEPDVVLDEDTKSLLDDAYKRIAQSRTVLFIPRRLSTLRRCEEIVFIHQGKLAAIGPRDRLVKISPLYRHWEYLNFNEFRHEFETGAE